MTDKTAFGELCETVAVAAGARIAVNKDVDLAIAEVKKHLAPMRDELVAALKEARRLLRERRRQDKGGRATQNCSHQFDDTIVVLGRALAKWGA